MYMHTREHICTKFFGKGDKLVGVNFLVASHVWFKFLESQATYRALLASHPSKKSLISKNVWQICPLPLKRITLFVY